MTPVIIESPYAGDVERNLAYAKRCLADSLRRGEAPLASHLLYPQVLDDLDPAERAQGIAAGYAWMSFASLIVFYTDLGWSRGMQAAWDYAINRGYLTEIRQINGPSEKEPSHEH